MVSKVINSHIYNIQYSPHNSSRLVSEHKTLRVGSLSSARKPKETPDDIPWEASGAVSFKQTFVNAVIWADTGQGTLLYLQVRGD